jgi:hypothetical protein
MVYYYSVKIKTGLEEVHIGENAGPFEVLVLPGTVFGMTSVKHVELHHKKIL